MPTCGGLGEGNTELGVSSGSFVNTMNFVREHYSSYLVQLHSAVVKIAALLSELGSECSEVIWRLLKCPPAPPQNSRPNTRRAEEACSTSAIGGPSPASMTHTGPGVGGAPWTRRCSESHSASSCWPGARAWRLSPRGRRTRSFPQFVTPRGGETSGPHAHLRLIIVLVPVFNHRASTHLPKSFSVDPTHSMWTFTGRRCNADTLAGSSFNWPPCTICALHDNTWCPNNSTYEGYYFCSNPTQPSEMFA